MNATGFPNPSGAAAMSRGLTTVRRIAVFLQNHRDEEFGQRDLATKLRIHNTQVRVILVFFLSVNIVTVTKVKDVRRYRWNVP